MRRRGPRTFIVTTIAVVAAIILSACGADVNTQLSLQDDHSGQRQFVLTMAEEDAQALEGGVEAAEQALEAHVPDVLTFDGLESEQEGYSATFTLHFDDPDDYHDKISALLDASDVAQSDRDMDITIDEEQLLTEVSFEEDFYNNDLMGWASEALIAEDVVTTNNPVLTTNGTASVLYDGEEIETSTSLPRINFSLTDDRRFEEIGLDVEVEESGHVIIAMSYFVSPDDTAAQNEFLSERVEQLNGLDGVDGAVEDSGAVENHGSGNTEIREISATFTSPEAVESAMQILLANDEATFNAADVANDDSPNVITEYSGANWTCEAICNPDNIQQLTGETVYPDDWQLVDQRRDTGDFYLELNRGMPLDSLVSTTKLGLTGSMEQSFEFVVDNETLEANEEAIAQLFEPEGSSGTLNRSSRDGKTIFAITFDAADSDTLVNEINGFLEDKGITETVTLAHEPLSGIWADYAFDIDLSAIWELATGGVEDTATFQVELPPMHSGESQSAETSGNTLITEDSSGSVSMNASGPSTTTVWVVLILIFLLIVVSVAAVIMWRRYPAILTGLTKRADSASAKPYNVQRQYDNLTESQIYKSSLAPDALGDPAAKTTTIPNLSKTAHMLIDDHRRPFPDVPLPSVEEYQNFQNDEDSVDDVEPSEGSSDETTD